MIPALVRAAESAQVTDWGPRIALTLLVLAVIGLAIWGMRRGWLARGRRQADLPAPPTVPPHVVADGPGVPAVPGMYVATTSTGDLLDRIVVHGLGNRGRADLYLRTDGVLIDRVGGTPQHAQRIIGLTLTAAAAGTLIGQSGIARLVL